MRRVDGTDPAGVDRRSHLGRRGPPDGAGIDDDDRGNKAGPHHRGLRHAHGGGYAVAATGGFLSEYEYQPPHLLVDVLLAILGIALFIVGLIVLFAAWSWLPGLLARLVGTLFRCDHKGGYRHSYPCEWRDWLWEVQEAFEEDDKPYTDADYERRYSAFYFTEPRYREQLLREEPLYRERLYRQRDDDWR